MLLIRFRDGSWLRVDTEELRSDLPMHVLRQPLPDRDLQRLALGQLEVLCHF